MMKVVNLEDKISSLWRTEVTQSQHSLEICLFLLPYSFLSLNHHFMLFYLLGKKNHHFHPLLCFLEKV